MNGQPSQGQPPRKSGGGIGGVVLAVLVVLGVIGVIGWVGAHASQQVTVTTCTNTVTPSCYQTTVPVSTQGP